MWNHSRQNYSVKTTDFFFLQKNTIKYTKVNTKYLAQTGLTAQGENSWCGFSSQLYYPLHILFVRDLHQRFSIPPPPAAYLACLSLLTHLIQIISSLEVRSVHELCSDWHAPYTVYTRTVIENCWFTHSVSSPGRAYQVVHKSQMSAFEVVAAFLIIHALVSRLTPPLCAPATKQVCDKWRQKSFSTL